MADYNDNMSVSEDESVLEAAEDLGMSYDEFVAAWQDENHIPDDVLEELRASDLIYSGDLEEATYRMPHEVLDANCEEVFDTKLADYKPYTVFEEIWKTHCRTIDMTHLIEKGYWPDIGQFVETCSGSFMGDAFSFIHLVLFLVGSIRAAAFELRQPRPKYGQSIGDDVILVKTRFELIMRYKFIIISLGGKFSKLDSVCEDAGTFCESYFAKTSDELFYRSLSAFKDSLFGDVFFLDIIKGSLLGGQTKVRQSGSDPFLGHGNMLSQQVGWHPNELVKLRAPKFLWAVHYRAATKLNSAMVTLPRNLGGMELAIREPLTEDHPWFVEHHGYYETMLYQPLSRLLTWFTLLRGIFLSNPKGFSWSNDYEIISKICENCIILSDEQVLDLLPSNMRGAPYHVRKDFTLKKLRMISFFDLADYLARQESFLKQWDMRDPPQYINQTASGVSGRQMYAWGCIKTDITPMEPHEFRYPTIKLLSRAFRVKTEGLWVSKDDPSIEEALSFMPSLFC